MYLYIFVEEMLFAPCPKASKPNNRMVVHSVDGIRSI
jgi:hypothetical protein